MFIDVHVHYLSESIFKTAVKCGMQKAICNSSNITDWQKIIDLSQKVPEVLPAIGIHPWFVAQTPAYYFNQMEELLQKYPNVLVGEIGLDKTHPYFDKQLAIFNDCLGLALKYKRPCSIHCVRAWDVILPILREYPLNVIVHRFSKGTAVINSLGDNVFYSVNSLKNVRNIPLDKLLLESDAPDGLKNPCALIKLQQTLGIPFKTIQNNFDRFLNGSTL